jgi:hypothetical protein
MFDRALQIENYCTANVLRHLNKWKSKLEVLWPTEITQLGFTKDMVMNKVANHSAEDTVRQSKLRDHV